MALTKISTIQDIYGWKIQCNVLLKQYILGHMILLKINKVARLNSKT